MKNPCEGCPDRYPACSDHCQKPERIAYRQDVDARAAYMSAYNQRESDCWAAGKPFYAEWFKRKNRT